MRRMRFGGLVIAALMLLVTATACVDTPSSEQRKEAVTQRTTVFERAQQAAPVWEPTNFPLRKALVEFTKAQDRIDTPWYIYVLGMNGDYVGYFVGSTYPINTCNFLSSSEEVISATNVGVAVLTAPSLDGMYYGGAGGSSSCDAYFFFDEATGAAQVFKAPMFYAANAPLDLDVPRINAVAVNSDD